MLMHEKLLTGQFFDLKTDRKPLLHHHHHHHHLQQYQLPHSQLQQPSHLALPKMDLYAAYAYQQQLLSLSQQQQQQQQPVAVAAEVLDLSRRCDSVETPRKTPSPYQTNYSYGSGSPAASPTAIPSNLLYSTQAAAAAVQQQQQQQQQQHQLATLYPALYYGNGGGNSIKQEPSPAAKTGNSCSATASLLQTFAAASAAAAAAAAVSASAAEHLSRPASNASTMQIDVLEAPQSPPAPTNATATAGESHKTTRPFKAFPRDPLVIAANFAATDVLLDNPRVERYTEYRKRVLEQIRSSNGGARTVTNPKMRRTNSRSGSVNEGSSSNNNSESEDRAAAEESSDCDSHAGNFEKLSGSGNAGSRSASGAAAAAAAAAGTGGGQVKDAAYYERRRKNNAAAKKSRDRRRIKEDEIAIRAAYLERQNIELLCQIDALKAQLAAFTAKVAV
ncbi:protein giant [Drosophila novamexicana]|uniref:protein giant n=1 Tax=Drosophila novamexicana TaxID=47314 RepID=UPI0011E5C712|nr:protein giant [Drosophila novamexicana]